MSSRLADQYHLVSSLSQVAEQLRAFKRPAPSDCLPPPACMLTTASPASAAPAAAAYGLRPTPFSGLSLIASRPLNPGTLVLADKPLFVLPQTVKDPEELYARVRALGPDGVRTYLGLANSKGKERDVTPLMGIFKVGCAGKSLC